MTTNTNVIGAGIATGMLGLAVGGVIVAMVFSGGSSGPSEECLRALDSGDQVVEHFYSFAQVAADGFGAMSDFDVYGLERASERLEELTPGILASVEGYADNADDCRNQ